MLGRLRLRTWWSYGLLVALVPMCALGIGTIGFHTKAATAAFPGANGKIAFIRVEAGTGVGSLDIISPDGSSQEELATGTGNVSYFSPSWSPDGSRVAVVRRLNPMTFHGLEVFLYQDDFSSSGPVEENLNPPGFPICNDRDPAWSPDGMKLAIARECNGTGGIYTINPDGTARTFLNADGDQPSWSPDGTQIAFVSQRDGDSEIYVMNSDGSAQTRLTFNVGVDSDPDWSPDGTKIVFSRYASDGTDSDVYTMDPDGNNQTDITPDSMTSAFDPAWSPDGSRIAFISSDDGGEVFTMNPDGSGQSQVTHTSPGYAANTAWQPLFDADGDGCADYREQRTYDNSELTGGRRDYLNPNDYFNPTDDGQNRIDDIIAVINQYFDDAYLDPPANKIPNPSYNPDTDRTDDPAYGLEQPWRLLAGNGEQRIDDILAAIKQFFHDCA